MEISVAIIVKNEEDVIRRCLKCVNGFANEIIVVDTGSIDETKEIIRKEYPDVKLYDSEKFNKETHFSDFEFGTAKNEAMSKCTKPWIIWWDADDYISEEGADKIKEIADKSELDVIYDFKVVYGNAQFYHSRMLPRCKDIKFDENHSCHEFLIASKEIRRFRREDIEIEHLPGKKGGLKSVERNIKILEKDYYKKDRKDPRTLFYLANSYRENDQYKEAIKFYEVYLEKSEWREERLFSLYYKARCHFIIDEQKEAREEALNALKEDDRFAEIYCILGDMDFADGKFKRAKAWFTMAMILEEPPKDSVLFVVPSLYNTYPKRRIDECNDEILIQVTRPKVQEELKKVLGSQQPKLQADKTIAIEVLSSVAGQILSAMAISSYVKKFPYVKIYPHCDGNIIENIFNGISNVNLSEGAEIIEEVSIELPDELRNKHCIDWMTRSLGFITKEFISIHSATKVKRDNKRVLLVTETIDEEDWPSFKWDLLVEKLNSNEYKVEYYNDFMLDSEEFFSHDYGMIIGQNGIAPQLAKLLGTKAIILHGSDENLKNYGYTEQISITQKLNKITVNDVFNQVESFLVEVE